MKTKKKTRARKIVKPRSFRPLLKEIVRFLNVNDEESDNLWHILTALRGPDKEEHTAKYATTGIIRNEIGLESLSFGAVVTEDETSFALWRQKNPYCSHFLSHAQRAFTVLGLKWNKVNKG